ncbi:NlpC/P60 family protein [Lactiplantibacillus paraxiangfangensis]|uniref:NlpC/P60 family protein n=1 Tax=Lactiplantibacillus paraxiangfangensis TaxID=3076224 RepID=UPI0030C718B4
MATVQNELKTKISVDGVGAIHTYKELKSVISGVTAEYRAEEAQLKSQGKYTEAAVVKAKGLSKALELQKAKVNELKSRQKDLDLTTQKGIEANAKLGTEISNAERKLSSYTQQQDKAKNSLKYYSSGLSELQHSYQQSSKLSESFVTRLMAEGKTAEANKQKLKGYEGSVSNLSKQFKIQESELSKLASSSGKSSEAYKRQQLRVNETATALAKLKGETNSLEGSMRKASASPFAKAMDSARHKLGLLNSEERKSTENVKHFALGSAIGNSLANAAGSAMSLVKEAGAGIIHAGLEFNKETQKMNATWTTLTGSAKKGTGFVTSINKMSSAFGQSNDLVNELDQQFYHVLDKKAPTEHLTKSLLTMADTLGMSGDQVQRLGLNFTHMMSSGRMQLGDFNMISDQLPMFGERLLDYERKAQNNTKLNMSDLRKQMSAGKISAKDAEAVMNGLGNKYKKASENMMATAFGAERSIKSQFSKLSGDLVAPFSKVQNPIFTSVSKWVSDKKTEKEFTKVGTSASKGFSTISTAFEKAMNVKSIPRSMNKFMENLAKGVTSTSKAIAKHAPAIIGFFKDLWSTTKILGSIGTGFFKGIASGISVIVSPLSKMGTSSKHVSALTKGLENLSKKKSGLQTFGRVLAGIWATTKVIKFIGAVQKAGTVLKSTWAGQAIISGMSTMIKNVKLFTEVTKGATLAEKASFTIQTAMEAVNPFGWVVLAVAGLAVLGTGIYEAYKHFKPFRDAVTGVGHAMSKLFTGKYDWEKTIGKKLSKVGSTISKWGKGAGKFVSKHKKEILAGIVSPFAGLSAWFLKDTKTGKNVQKWVKGFSKDVKKMGLKKAMDKQVKSAGKAFSKSKFGKWFATMSDAFNSWKKKFSKSWSSHWSAMTKKLHTGWKDSVKNTKNFFSSMGSHFSSFKKSWSHNWDKHWDDMRSNLHSYWNKDLKHTKVFGTSMGKWLDDFKKMFKGGWRNLGKGVSSIFSDMWKGLKQAAQGGMNGTLDIVNGGIKAVDAVIHTFGGKSQTIKPLNHVKLATGTGFFSGMRKPITKPTLAVLNDGHDSPETGNKEIVMKHDGRAGVVQGVNTEMMLEAGDEVFNASEAKNIMAMQGVTRYANGTGFFGSIMHSVSSTVGGAVDWVGNKVKGLEKYFKTAENVIAHPVKSLEGLFKWTDGKTKGVMTDIGEGLFKDTTKQAKTWWSTLWGAVSSKLDGGTGSDSGLVNAMEKYGATNKYVWGAAGPSAFDCSGLVEYTLKKMGISFPRTSGEQYRASKHVSDPKPGDLVFFGPGGSEHVGVYTGNGKFYSAENEKDGMGISSVHGGGYGSFAGYGRVPGLSSGGGSSSKSEPKSKGLLGTIKNQVGTGFWSFISKLADMFGDDGNGSIEGGAITHSMINRALKEMKIPRSYWSKMQHDIIGVANSETGNRNIAQTIKDSNSEAGNGAAGPLQFTYPTFKAFEAPKRHNWRSSYDQVTAYLNNSDYLHAAGNTVIWHTPKFDWLHSGPRGHKRFANGGLVSTNQLIEVAEKNRQEMVIPLTLKTRANQLIKQASSIVNGNRDEDQVAGVGGNDGKLDKLIKLVTALLAGQGNVNAIVAKSDVVNAVKADNLAKAQYSQMMGY